MCSRAKIWWEAHRTGTPGLSYPENVGGIQWDLPCSLVPAAQPHQTMANKLSSQQQLSYETSPPLWRGEWNQEAVFTQQTLRQRSNLGSGKAFSLVFEVQKFSKSQAA